MRLQLTLALLACAASARADGVVSVRGGYYKERSTRVQQPMIDAAFDAGEKARLTGHFLIDSITSASVATGAGGVEFNERRYEAGLGFSYQLTDRLRLGTFGRYSTESDYDSAYVSANAELALFRRATTLRLNAGHAFDSITNGVAVEMSSIGTPRLEESLGTTLLSLGVGQVLNRRLVAGLTYDFIHMSGYQANLYRVVRGGTEPVPERVPDLRLRHAIAASVRAFLPTRTTAILGYRLYVDDWGIVAHTPEVRLVQEVVRGIDLRLRYRYYTQSAADFFSDVYTQAELSDPMAFVTDDEKLSAFRTHTLGGQVAVTLELFGLRGTLADVTVDGIVERIWQTTAFGDAWVGQVGVAIPFAY